MAHTLTVKLNDTLSEVVASKVGKTGSFENVSEYIRHLIRCDKEHTEQQAFDRLKAELALAFAEPDDTYIPLTASEVIKRNHVEHD